MEPIVSKNDTELQKRIDSLDEFVKDFEDNDKNAIIEIMKTPDKIIEKNFENPNEEKNNHVNDKTIINNINDITIIKGIICFKAVNTLQCPKTGTIKDYFNQFYEDLKRSYLFYVPQWEKYYKYKIYNNISNFYNKFGENMTNFYVNLYALLNIDKYRQYYKNSKNRTETNNKNILLNTSCECKEKKEEKYTKCRSIKKYDDKTTNDINKYESLFGIMNIINQSLKSYPFDILHNILHNVPLNLNVPLNEDNNSKMYYVDRDNKNIIYMMKILSGVIPLFKIYIVYPIKNDDYTYSYYFIVPIDNSSLNNKNDLVNFVNTKLGNKDTEPTETPVKLIKPSRPMNRVKILLKKTFKNPFRRNRKQTKTKKKVDEGDEGYINFIKIIKLKKK